MKIISVIGYHHSGKTTVVENLMRYIKSKGFSVSSIKDIHISNFSMEKQGSNSYRHLRANDNCVFARGINETYLIWNRQLSLNEMLTHLDTDWVIIEGMRNENVPKILAVKNLDELEELYDNNVIAISGIYSEVTTMWNDKPIINAMRNIRELGELILNEIIPL